MGFVAGGLPDLAKKNKEKRMFIYTPYKKYMHIHYYMLTYKRMFICKYMYT